MLKGASKDRELDSSDEIEEVITKVWDELTFDAVIDVSYSAIQNHVFYVSGAASLG
jgi:predicted ATPase